MPRAQMPDSADVAAYAAELRYDDFDAQAFCDYWESRGWMMRPGIPMRDWRAGVRTWQRNRQRWAAEKAAAAGKPAPGLFSAAERAAIADYAAQAARIIRYERGYNIDRLYNKIRDALGPLAVAEVRRQARGEGGLS